MRTQLRKMVSFCRQCTKAEYACTLFTSWMTFDLYYGYYYCTPLKVQKTKQNESTRSEKKSHFVKSVQIADIKGCANFPYYISAFLLMNAVCPNSRHQGLFKSSSCNKNLHSCFSAYECSLTKMTLALVKSGALKLSKEL